MNALLAVEEREVADEVARMRREATAELGWEPAFDGFSANAELVYAHFPQVGSVGVILDRSTGRVHVLGSANPVESCVWAYYRGFDLSGDNRMRITAVHDPDEAIEVLKRGFTARYVRNELAPQFTSLPLDLEIPAFSLYRMLAVLPTTRAFDFEVTP